MSDNNTFERLQSVFSSVIGAGNAATITPTSTMDEVEGWDSMNFINLVIAVETEYKIRIDGLDAASMVTIPSILEYLDRQLAK